MQALSLSQPWAWSIVNLDQDPKRIENRSQQALITIARSMIGKRIALQAAKSYDKDGADFLRELGLVVPMKVETDLTAGKVIGVATIKDAAWCETVADVNDLFFPHPNGHHPWPAEQRRYAFGRGCILLEDVRAIETPVPCRGALGFWPLPYDVERKVLEQLDVAGG